MKQFRTKISSPDFDDMTKDYQEEKDLNKKFETEIKEQIKLWSESIPANAHSDLNTAAKIESTSTAPIQRVVVSSWIEQRLVSQKIENLQPKPQNEINIESNNLWGPEIKLKDLKSKTTTSQNFFIKGTEETISCTSGCQGTGSFTCTSCHGKSKCTCSQCKGAGQVKCRVCRGSGETERYVESLSVYESATTGKKRLENDFKKEKSICINCRGTKQEPCSGCMGRKVVDCTNCRSGVVFCKGCSGSGSQKAFMQLSVTFTPVIKTLLFYPKSYENFPKENLPTLNDADFVTLIQESIDPTTWKTNKTLTKLSDEKIQSIQKAISSVDYNPGNKSEKFAGLYLTFEQAPCIHAVYQYKNEFYHLWFAGLGQRMVTEDSPFRREAERLIKEMETELHKNKIVDQLPKLAFLMELSSNSMRVQETYLSILKNLYDNIDSSVGRENVRFNLANSFQLFQIKKALHPVVMSQTWNENVKWYNHEPDILRRIFRIIMFIFIGGSSIYVLGNFKNLFQSSNPKIANGDIINALIVGSIVLAYLLGGVTWTALSSLRKGNDVLWKLAIISISFMTGALWFFGIINGHWPASATALILIVVLAKIIPTWHLKAEKQKIELPNPSDKATFLKSLHDLIKPYQRFADSHFSMISMQPVPVELKTDFDKQRITLSEAEQAEKSRIAKSLTDSLKK